MIRLKKRLSDLDGLLLVIGDTVLLIDERNSNIVECHVTAISAQITGTVMSVKTDDGKDLDSYLIGRELQFERDVIQTIVSERPTFKLIGKATRFVLTVIALIILVRCFAQPLDESCRPGPVQRGADICD